MNWSLYQPRPSRLRGRRRPASRSRSGCRARPKVEGLEGRQLLNAGALDTSFGSAGTLLADPNFVKGTVDALVVQPDGKIVAAVDENSLTGNASFALVRYNTDGSLDKTFGTGGLVTT